MKPQTLLSVLRECTELGLLAHLDAAASAALERQVGQMHPKTHPMTLAVLAAAPDTIWRCPAAPQADSPAALLAALRTLGHGHFPATNERAQPLATPDGAALEVSFMLGERRYEAVISLGHAPLERVVDLANRALADAGDDGRFEWLFFREEATRTTEAGPYRVEALIFLTYEQHGQVVQRDLARLAEHYRYPLAVPRGFEDTTRALLSLGLLDPRDAARLGEVRAAWQQRGSPPSFPRCCPLSRTRSAFSIWQIPTTRSVMFSACSSGSARSHVAALCLKISRSLIRQTMVLRIVMLWFCLEK